MRRKIGVWLLILGIKLLLNDKNQIKALNDRFKSFELLKDINSLDKSLGELSRTGALFNYARISLLVNILSYLADCAMGEEPSNDGWLLLSIMDHKQGIDIIKEGDIWHETNVKGLYIHDRNEAVIKKDGKYFYKNCIDSNENSSEGFSYRQIRLPFVDTLQFVEVPEHKLNS